MVFWLSPNVSTGDHIIYPKALARSRVDTDGDSQYIMLKSANHILNALPAVFEIKIANSILEKITIQAKCV